MRTSSNQSRGAILVFFALVMVVLLGFVALVIDTGIGEGARSEQQALVQNAALAAMSSYLDALKTPTPNGSNQAISKAKSRAEAILKASNRMSEGFRQTPNASTSLSTDGSTAGEGQITFGKMVWALPTAGAGATPDASTAACHGKTPCFLPEEQAGGGVTAVKVKTQTNNNPIRTIFGRVLGINRYDMSASAVATLIPQNYLFLVDLSSSMTDQSHHRVGMRNNACTPSVADHQHSRCTDDNWFSNPACFLPHSAWYFAYEIDPDKSRDAGCNSGMSTLDPSCACLTNSDNTVNCFNLSAATTEVGSVGSIGNDQRSSRRVFGGYSNWWSGPGLGTTNSYFVPSCRVFNSGPSFPGQCAVRGDAGCAAEAVNTPAPIMRYRSDYRLVAPGLGADLIVDPMNPTVNPSKVLVDFGGNSPNYLGKPEPLGSVLSATHEAMDFIGTRAVVADRFMLSGFDETMHASRTTCTTGSAESCDLGNTLVSPNSDSFRGFLNLTDKTLWSNYSSGTPYHFLNRRFFPRIGYNTDIQLALWKAYDELSQTATASTAKNLVFLITDGLANCKVPSNVTTFNTLDQYLAAKTCDGNLGTIGSTVISAIKQMNSGLTRSPYNKTLVQLFQEKKITVSVILIGNNMQPHYLVRKSSDADPSAGCLTNGEAVYGEIPFVDWDTSATGNSYRCTSGPDCVNGFDNALLKADATNALITGTGTLPLSNLLYEELVAPTAGAWIPIMRTLQPDSNGTGTNFSAQLTTACNNKARPALGNPPTVDQLSPRLTNASVDIGGSNVVITDSQGRLMYDPYGRSQKDQIIEQVKQVLGGGFVLVEPAN